ncbi:hypothetical protein EVAR_26626_1 [Eumeta japonica]|uniref:Uncharacterized protein n=1 Tax=Eumeta variegata TaxID=151549 RepID=A0A4C1XJZ3_EUMVA|nr:hypothetical protein EVAR_26626_1 [Eumeta japonica]
MNGVAALSARAPDAAAARRLVRFPGTWRRVRRDYRQTRLTDLRTTDCTPMLRKCKVKQSSGPVAKVDGDGRQKFPTRSGRGAQSEIKKIVAVMFRKWSAKKLTQHEMIVSVIIRRI